MPGTIYLVPSITRRCCKGNLEDIPVLRHPLPSLRIDNGRFITCFLYLSSSLHFWLLPLQSYSSLSRDHGLTYGNEST